jgi:O-antigen/teichoic acid export membrane protein
MSDRNLQTEQRENEQAPRDNEPEQLSRTGNVRSRVLAGTAWLFLEKAGVGIFEFAVAWVLARFFLDPSEYAVVGIAAIFIAFANLFAQGSFNYALVQRPKIDENDRSTVFWLVFAVSLVLYGILFLCAPLIAAFYKNPVLTLLTRIQGLTLIFDALCVVQTAILTREIKFRTIFLKTAVTAFCSGAVGITCAVLGLGAWALVFQTLTASVAGCVFLWCAVKWKPKARFSGASLKSMFGFSSAMFTSNVINNVYSSALPLAMEKVYAEATLGYYNKSKTIPTKLGDAINQTVGSIAFPSLSAFQDDPKRAKEMLRRFITTACFVMFAVMAGLAAVAKPMILFVYSAKWAGSIIFMQFVCAMFLFLPMDSANLQAIKAFGKGGTYLIIEIIKSVLGIAVLAASMLLTRGMANALYIVLGCQVVVNLVSTWINAFPNRKLLGYGFGEQLKDVLPSLLLALFMGGAVWSVTLLKLPNLVTLLIQVPLGILIYAGGAKLFKFECFEYLIRIVKEKLGKSRKNAPENISGETTEIAENISGETIEIAENISGETTEIAENISGETTGITENITGKSTGNAGDGTEDVQ